MSAQLIIIEGLIGIGKSTLASLISSEDNLFQTSPYHPETLGTWISSSISIDDWAKFSNNQLFPNGKVDGLEVHGLSFKFSKIIYSRLCLIICLIICRATGIFEKNHICHFSDEDN